MSRSDRFHRLRRVARAAELAEVHQLPAKEVLERMAARERSGLNRRGFLKGAAALAAAGMLPRTALGRPASRADAEIAIIGAGLAGLSCAWQLQGGGVRARIYEASERTGGRCYSLGGAFPGAVEFPGQVVELGGELIDTTHWTMSAYIQTFKLDTEVLTKGPGETFWYLDGALRDEAEIVEEYRAFVPRMREDLQSTSGGPTAEVHTDGDRVLDYTSLAEYLETRGAGDILKAALDSAYVGEYGAELDRQSCLSFLYFIHADRRSKFREFGVFSDERYHIRGGNQQIPARLTEALEGQIERGMWLTALSRAANGRYRMTFDGPGGTVDREADVVVLATPFSTLRNVHLDASLGLPDWKRYAIDNLDYGTNAKTMVGFDQRVWRDVGCSGLVYARGLPNVQVTWETNPDDGGPQGVITDYAGGDRGAALRTNRVQRQVSDWLNGMDQVIPGMRAAASRDARGDFRAILQHWPTVPTALGSYTNNQPGYFTTIADNEGRRVDNLLFVGEHADSFYEWQGFMEGAAGSGVRAGTELLHDIKSGVL